MKRAFIHLPNGQTFELNRTSNEEITGVEVVQLRSSMKEAVSFSSEAFTGPNFDKKVILVLWGEVLKNSFITIE